MTTFQPHLCQLVLAGEKTQTRRLWRSDDCLENGVLWRTDKNGTPRKKFEIGKCYAVQPGRGRKALGTMRVESIREHFDVRSIWSEDAHKEGFTSSTEFIHKWMYLNDKKGFKLLQKTTWNEFEFLEFADTRPDSLYHAWVIEFRYLSATSTSESVTAEYGEPQAG